MDRDKTQKHPKPVTRILAATAITSGIIAGTSSPAFADEALADLIEPYAAADVGEETFEAAVQQLIDHAYQRSEAVQEFQSSVAR